MTWMVEQETVTAVAGEVAVDDGVDGVGATDGDTATRKPCRENALSETTHRHRQRTKTDGSKAEACTFSQPPGLIRKKPLQTMWLLLLILS